MRLLNTRFDPVQPCWRDYLPFLEQFTDPWFPGCAQLNELLPEGLSSEGHKAIRFVPSAELAGGAYEHQIYTTGNISTRPDHWHDLFNALVWARFPRIKLAMNGQHYYASSRHKGPGRGPQRDALTLFDECGVIVFSSDRAILESLAKRRWREAFVDSKKLWDEDVQVAISGHAMLEKFLTPYKSMTAKALLVQLDENRMCSPREELLRFLDREIATGIRAGKLISKPACLAPLPLAGIPRWWRNDQQNDQFYNDMQVFRLPPVNLKAVPIVKLG